MSHAIEKLQERRSLAVQLAAKYGMDTDVFLKTVAKTIMPAGANPATPEQTAAFLVVANQYGLNPFNREVYAFPAKSGGIQAIVSVDGWSKLANEHPAFDGVSFEDMIDEKGNLLAITCRIYRKDRSHAIEVTEYMVECKRNTDPWIKSPGRMLRHKAFIQCCRLAFGFAGIIDPDEAERFAAAGAITMHPDVQRVDLDALPEASLSSAPGASLDTVEKPRRGRPRKVREESVTLPQVTSVPQAQEPESVASPSVSSPQSVTYPSVTCPGNPDSDDPTDTPEYLAGIQQPGQ